jgi:hypothetical protein
MSSSKKIYMQREMFIFLRPPPKTPHPPPSHKLSVYIVIYCTLLQERVGGELNQ